MIKDLFFLKKDFLDNWILLAYFFDLFSNKVNIDESEFKKLDRFSDYHSQNNFGQ